MTDMFLRHSSQQEYVRIIRAWRPASSRTLLSVVDLDQMEHPQSLVTIRYDGRHYVPVVEDMHFGIVLFNQNTYSIDYLLCQQGSEDALAPGPTRSSCIITVPANEYAIVNAISTTSWHLPFVASSDPQSQFGQIQVYERIAQNHDSLAADHLMELREQDDPHTAMIFHHLVREYRPTMTFSDDYRLITTLQFEHRKRLRDLPTRSKQPLEWYWIPDESQWHHTYTRVTLPG